MIRPFATGMILLLGSAMPLASIAQSASPPMPSDQAMPAEDVPARVLPANDPWGVAPADEWQFHATIYGWLPDIGGKTIFQTDAGNVGVGISAKTIVRNLDFTTQAEFEAKKGRVGFLLDYIYMNLGGSKSNPGSVTTGGAALPPGVGSDLHLDVKGNVGAVGITYNMFTLPRVTMDVLGGARLFYQKERLDWTFTGDVDQLSVPPSGHAETKIDNWDAIIGVKGRVVLDSQGKWFIPYYLDGGAGESERTWQALVGLGYQFHWGSINASYRWLDYEFKPDSAISDMSYNGPALGVSFKW